jgi:hypothetical protein
MLNIFLFFFPQFEDLGMVTSIESNHKTVPSARKGMEVCIKIEPYPSEAPKMFGRHFDETDMLVSKVSQRGSFPWFSHKFLRFGIINRKKWKIAAAKKIKQKKMSL